MKFWFLKKGHHRQEMSTYQISQSSLLSLKAEILRKQQELAKAKVENEVKREVIKKKTPLELKNKGVDARKRFDDTEEDQDLLKQSSIALQQKAKIYDELKSGKLDPADHSRFLVRFDKKDGSDLPPIDSDDEPDKSEDSTEEFCDTDDDLDPSEKWVTYTDCLGRTRKCMAKDLEHIKRNDEKLKKVVEKKQRQDVKDEGKVVETIEVTEKNEERSEEEKALPEMMSDQMKNEILRRQWEKDEERLRDKVDVHYQDVLFGEARSHGVGYYGFSTDENERLRQQEALKKLRKETEEKQAQARRLKEMRDQQLAARVKAAKERKRIRLGLPPEEDEPPEPPKPEESEEEKKKQEDEQKEREAAEKILEELRKKHVRPWDVGKEGVKVFEEMTQDEWVEEKRNDRPEEFAPPETYKRNNFRSSVKKETLRDEDNNEGLKFSTIKHNKKKKNMKKKIFNETSRVDRIDNKGDHQQHVTDANFQEIPQVQTFTPTPIVDEACGDFDDAILEDYRAAVDKVTCNTVLHNGECNQAQNARATEPKRTKISESNDNNDFEDALIADYKQSMKKAGPSASSFGVSPPPFFKRGNDRADFEDALMAHSRKTVSCLQPNRIKSGQSPPPFFKRGNDRGDFEDALMVHPRKSVDRAIPSTHHNKRRLGESSLAFVERRNDRKDFEDAHLTEKAGSGMVSGRNMPSCSRNGEVPSNDFDDSLLADYRISSQSDRGRRGVEVPPPATFDYYGPSGGGAKKKGVKLGGEEIEQSIEAGLKLLRRQVEEKEKSKGRPDEMFLL